MAERIAAAESVVEEKRAELEGAVGDKRAEVEAAHEAESVATTSASPLGSEELATAAQGVEASIKEGGKTVAEDVVFAPPARSSCAPARRPRQG